jgi:hypothetical protein
MATAITEPHRIDFHEKSCYERKVGTPDNTVNQLVKCGVLFEVRTEFLNSTHTSFKGLILQDTMGSD